MFYWNAKIIQCKYQKQSTGNKINKTKTNKTKFVLDASISRKKGDLYNTYHELLSEKWIVKRSRFHESYIISPQTVPIFAISYLVGCIKYQYNSLEGKVEKNAVATFYQGGWIGYRLQDILGQKF